jgi:hypothetical protein
VNDLNILLSELGNPVENCLACDLNNDGAITTLDILALVKLNLLLARNRRLRILFCHPGRLPYGTPFAVMRHEPSGAAQMISIVPHPPAV